MRCRLLRERGCVNTGVLVGSGGFSHLEGQVIYISPIHGKSGVKGWNR